MIIVGASAVIDGWGHVGYLDLINWSCAVKATQLRVHIY